MLYTLELLGKGDMSVPTYYRDATVKWAEILQTRATSSVAEWAEWITSKQITFFEARCGGRWLGQEVMAWSGFASLYDESTGMSESIDTAVKLLRAFQTSAVSMEVKGYARRAAAYYDVGDDPEGAKLLRSAW